MQNRGPRAGIFHGKIDRCREGQRWTTTCSSMPELDGKDNDMIAQRKRARAGSRVTVD